MLSGVSLQDVRDYVENIVKRLLGQYVDHLLKRRQDKLRGDVIGQMNKLLDAVPTDMWPRIANIHDCALERAQSKLRTRLARTYFVPPPPRYSSPTGMC